jgi:hypothetical protein
MAEPAGQAFWPQKKLEGKGCMAKTANLQG